VTSKGREGVSIHEISHFNRPHVRSSELQAHRCWRQTLYWTGLFPVRSAAIFIATKQEEIVTMQFDVNLQSPSLSEVGDIATVAEDHGFECAWITEVTHSPYTLMTRMASETNSIDIGTAIAVAFPRSPMVTAYSAWDVQSLSDGRVLLGLGTQVKGHIEHRFSVEWDSPGPRLRDYVRSLRAIWDAWATGTDVDYQGEFYSIDLCPPEFTPDPIDDPDVPIYVAGVNPYNLKIAGELCDGLHIHPVHSPEYIEEVVVPNVAEGAKHGDRTASDVTLAASVFAIVGESELERSEKREQVRKQIAFYGSTRTYKTIFGVHGWEEVCDDLHELSVNDRWDEMGNLVTDEMIDAFSVEAATYGDLRKKIESRYDHVDRISVYEPFRGEEQWAALAD
jgi:probable F420-dependent oxidoreductase